MNIGALCCEVFSQILLDRPECVEKRGRIRCFGQRSQQSVPRGIVFTSLLLTASDEKQLGYSISPAPLGSCAPAGRAVSMIANEQSAVARFSALFIFISPYAFSR